ncbi:hypothetical protein ACIQ2D_20785 [Lysinibacillus sp. NPDC097287]|uniref:hypothetical protein n=1 Tax=Lysinibacillus sp. NPDC097287 TaxID=3364144 RepID=UPI0038063E54
MTTEKSKGGRPQKYPYEELRSVLFEYANKNSGKLITLADLGRETKFPRYVWRNNKQIREDIEKLNQTPMAIVGLMKENVKIPSAEDLVNSNYHNKNLLITRIQQVLDAYQTTFEQVLKTTELENRLNTKEKEIASLKEEIDALKKQSAFYQEKYESMTLHSTSLLSRKNFDLKENVIDAEKKFKEIDDEFEDLFK